METNQENQIVRLETDNFTPTHALVTEVKLSDGRKTQIISIFNINEVGFEEVNIGVLKGLSMQDGVHSMKSTLNNINSNGLEKKIYFDEKIFSNENRYQPQN